MALGHTRHKLKKDSKGQEADHGRALSTIELPDSAPDLVAILPDHKDEPTRSNDTRGPHEERRAVGELRSASSSQNAADAATPDIGSTKIQTMTKSARKRAASRRKKEANLSKDPVMLQETSVGDEQVKDQDEFKDTPTNAPPTLANAPGTSKAKNTKGTTKKKPRNKKENRAESQLRNSNANVEVIVATSTASARDSSSLEALPQSAKPEPGKNKRTNDNKTKSKASRRGQIEDVALLQHTDMGTNALNASNPGFEQEYSQHRNPSPPRSHARQKSMNVNLHLNGAQQKSICIDTPHHISPKPSRDVNDRPLKIKLPGREVTLVYPEDPQRLRSKHSKHRSQATSTSSQISGPSRASSGMRSRQSSHTTVGTTGALESKLQNMILSHACQSSPMTATISTASQPDQVAVSDSPLAAKSTSQSAPPVAQSQGDSGSEPLPPPSQQYLQDPERLYSQSGQVPAVPTLYQSRPSQLHAPPSLGSAQPQNLSDPILPFQYNGMPYPNSHMGYGSQHPVAAPYYNYYPLPPQNFNPYNNFQMGMQMPLYEQPINGTVYYNTDGTPMYPQDYYPGNYMGPDMYQ